tara:strand:+ start:597 stop:1559 length:963 start_codon:yes stop_codon:yes gene_type:complete
MVLRHTNYRVNSFRDIADRYANTKPIRGTDIIPIGGRNYKWERIIKRSDTHYDMVLDETVFSYHYGNPTQIVLVSWEMKNDIEVVTIHNNGYTTVYTFLENLLPHDLRFFVLGSSGRQYISMNWGSKKKYEYDWVIADQGDKDFYLPKDYSKPIQFARKHSKWQHVGTEYVFKYAMTQVNKEAKAEIKPHADKFYEWAITIHAMLPCGDWEYRNKMRDEFHDYMDENDVNHFYGRYGRDHRVTTEQTELYLNIMKDDSHTMRLHLAIDWLVDSPLFGYGGIQPIDTKEKASKVRASWNRWVNKTFGLTKNIHENRTEEVK